MNGVLHAVAAEKAGLAPVQLAAAFLALGKQPASRAAAKAPGDAAGFKAWLGQVGQAVADAASEGGFLGFGGVQVSEAEKATLDEIAVALA